MKKKAKKTKPTPKADPFRKALKSLRKRHEAFLATRNRIDTSWHNGIYDRWVNPVLTREHVPLEWRYDFNPKTNPHLLERLGVGGAYNAGAIYLDGRTLLVVRVEGYDRKSFFAVAESKSGVDRFRFWDMPLDLPEAPDPDVNVYDMRLTAHEDGWIYGLFCTERKDPGAAPGDLSSAVAQCGIARTKDLRKWQRLPDLRTRSAQQRNVVLHPEFVGGKYALYTRPQDNFIEAGRGGGIGWALCDSMENAETGEESIIDARHYHTIKEVKNGQGPPPIKTRKGWLHLAHGVRGCAAGLRYVLYVFVTALEDPAKVIAAPGGHFIAPLGAERVGDVSNVAFSNGWVRRPDGSIHIYYASSDTRMHVATTDEERMLDYAFNTPPDGLTTRRSLEQRLQLARQNSRHV